jgi:hypothetical protein
VGHFFHENPFEKVEIIFFNSKADEISPQKNTDFNGFKMLQVLKDKDHHPADEFGESLRFFLS